MCNVLMGMLNPTQLKPIFMANCNLVKLIYCSHL